MNNTPSLLLCFFENVTHSRARGRFLLEMLLPPTRRARFENAFWKSELSHPFALLKPIVFTLDGKHIADSYVDTIIYHDITPGIHSVNYNNGRSKLSINVPKGKSVFIKYTVVDDSVAAGNILPTIVDPKIAELEIRTISLIEKKIRYPNELR